MKKKVDEFRSWLDEYFAPMVHGTNPDAPEEDVVQHLLGELQEGIAILEGKDQEPDIMAILEG